MPCKQINLKITNYDWAQLINKLHQIKTFCDAHPERGVFYKSVDTSRYDFGNLGSFMPFNGITDIPNVAGCISGTMVESIIPWVDQLKKDLQGLIVSGITFQYNTAGLNRHIDGQVDSETKKHCKLNYMIRDENYSTFIDAGTEVLSYPTKKDTAWLIDTTLPHWVEGRGTRYIFQVSFHDSFDTVYQHLENLNLIY